MDLQPSAASKSAKPRSKYLRVTMPDKSRWDVPAGIIADSAAKYYGEKDSGESSGPKYEAAYREEYDHRMQDETDLIDWAGNNMDWQDVSQFAQLAPQSAQKPVDYQEGWVNGPKKVVQY